MNEEEGKEWEQLFGWPTVNHRRLFLIDKLFDEGLSGDESDELQELTLETDRYLAQQAPLNLRELPASDNKDSR